MWFEIDLLPSNKVVVEIGTNWCIGATYSSIWAENHVKFKFQYIYTYKTIVLVVFSGHKSPKCLFFLSIFPAKPILSITALTNMTVIIDKLYSTVFKFYFSFLFLLYKLLILLNKSSEVNLRGYCCIHVWVWGSHGSMKLPAISGILFYFG